MPTDALAAYVDRYLATQPLTEREARRGAAVRVVSCVRANDEDLAAEPSAFVWSVLVLARPGVSVGDLRLGFSCSTLSRLLGGGEPPAPVLQASATVSYQGEPWEVREYAVGIPRRLYWFSFAVHSAVENVGRTRRNELVNAHFERINNAAANEAGYAAWLETHRSQVLQAVPVPESKLLISIVCPVYKTPPEFLRMAVDSVLAQTYTVWELVVVNASPEDEGVRTVLAGYADPRIHVVDCPQNLGIAGNTNLGLEHCAGDYVCFLDHDDFVEPQALAAMVGAVEAAGEPVDLVYCDEDSVDETGAFKIPLFKPGRNLDLLCSNDYVIHWLMVSRHVLQNSLRSGKEVDGAQDYDLTFKAFECGRGAVRVPHVLYHWRIHSGSMNSNTGDNPGAKHYAQESGRRAIADYLGRRGITGTVAREKVLSTYRTDFALVNPPALTCYAFGEPSEELWAALAAYASGRRVDARVVQLAAKAPAAEVAAELASCETPLALVCRGGVELDRAALEGMLGYFERPEVFALSPRVLRRDGLLDCAGSIVLPDGGLCKMGHGLPAADEGYIGRLHRPYDAAVLNETCCILRVEALRELGLDAAFEAWPHMLADVCLRAFARGLANVYTPFWPARLTAPSSLLADEQPHAPADKPRLLAKHAALLTAGDPSHNPNFDPWSPHYKLA